ncbi:TetR/AcrR family transcriptional regulator [Clostridium lundense]|uniref:TetR/AcrR family transcriptional regulator n=1 Tax=Clostridium lundense TaxID=319475 RepID=UPI0006850242|nr:TetR/AcrR family transcriptional regulator [Clostridium lundense]
MPKIIKDLESTIFNISMKLFSEKGYEEVDMKMIAQKCGIAVGTLYNYYPNKKELYIATLKSSWDNTFNKFEELKTLSLSPKEKVGKALLVLYEDIEKRKGLGKELLNKNAKDLSEDIRVLEFREKLIKNLESYISCLEKKDDFKNTTGINEKLAETFLLAIPLIINSHHNEKEENIKFLNGILQAFIS